MPDELEPAQENGSLPSGEEDQRPAGEPEFSLPPEESPLGDLLPAPPNEVPGVQAEEPKRRRGRHPRFLKHSPKAGIRTLDQDYREWVKAAGGKEQKAEYRRQIKKKYQAIPSPLNGRYRFSAAWIKKWCKVDPAKVATYINQNKELARLRRIQAKSPSERKRDMAQAIREKVIKPLIEKKNALQAKIEPVMLQLMELNQQMRDILEKIDFARFTTINPDYPSDSELKRRIKIKIKQLTYGAARSIYQQQEIKLKELHGFHGYLKKKYAQPEWVDKDGRRLMRRRRGFIPKQEVKQPEGGGNVSSQE